MTVTLTTDGFALGSYNSSKIAISDLAILDSEGRDVKDSYTITNRAYISIREKPITISFDNENVEYKYGKYYISEEFDWTGETSYKILAHADAGCSIVYIIDGQEYDEFPETGFAKVGNYEIDYIASGTGFETQEGTFILQVLPINYAMNFVYDGSATSYNKVYDGLEVLPSISVTNYDKDVCDNSAYYANFTYYGYNELTEEYEQLFTYSPVTFGNETGRVYEAGKYYRLYGTEYQLINDADMPQGTIYLREEVRSVTNAGKYKVVATIPTGVNYKETSISDEFVISKATVVITPYTDMLTKVFNGTEVTLVNNNNAYDPYIGEYEYYGEGQVIVSYLDEVAGFKPYYAGTYEFQFIVQESTNFKAYESSVYTLTITQRDVVFYAPEQNTGYTGNNYAMASVTIGNNILGLSLVGDVICKETAMGTYGSDGTDAYDLFELAPTAKLFIDDKDVTGSIHPLFSMVLTINPVSAEDYVSYVGVNYTDNGIVTQNSLNFTYDGMAHGLGINVGNIDGGYKVIYSLEDITDPDFDITDDSNVCTEISYQFVDAGEYTVYYIITFDNYATIRGSKTISIAKKDVTTLTISDMNRAYNKKPVADPTVTTDSDGVYTFTYKYADGIPIANNARPINAGTYKVTVSLAEGNNYNSYEDTFEFTISPYEVTLKWYNLEVQYTGSEITPVVEFTKPLPDSTVSLSLSPDSVTNRDNYTITASLTGDASENYVIVEADRTVIFKVVRQIIVLPADKTEVYTGSDLNPYSSEIYTRSINEFINANEYSVVLTLVDKNNYTWELENGTLTTDDQTVNYTISQLDITCEENVTTEIVKLYNDKLVINPIPNQSYIKDGASQPIPVIKYNGKTLTTDDFDISYENNTSAFNGVDPSVATVTGKGNYKGTIKLEYKIISLLFTLANENNTIKFSTYRNGKYTVKDTHTESGASKKEYITNFKSNQTIESFLTMFEENQRDLIAILNTKNTPITDRTAKIISGYKIVLKDTDGNVKDSLIIAIHGDVNCDGVVNSQDYVLLRNYISGKTKLTDAAYVAGDINNDGVVNSVDFVLLSNKISGSSDYESSYIQ